MHLKSIKLLLKCYYAVVYLFWVYFPWQYKHFSLCYIESFPPFTTCNPNQNKSSDSASEKEPMAGIHFKDFASTKGYLFLYRQLCRNPFKCPFLSSAEQKERGFMSIDWPMGHLTNNRLKQTKSNQVWEGILSFSSLFWKGLLGKQTIDIRWQ
jgi:hypothetical protein